MHVNMKYVQTFRINWIEIESVKKDENEITNWYSKKSESAATTCRKY